MIAVDASAVLAILLDEPEGPAFAELLARNAGAISAINHWEVLARAYREGEEAAVARAEALIDDLDLVVADVSRRDSQRAVAAFAKFGKGDGGPLNLGDCFAYALAQVEGDGLLFKGDDFPKTDVKPAI